MTGPNCVAEKVAAVGDATETALAGVRRRQP